MITGMAEAMVPVAMEDMVAMADTVVTEDTVEAMEDTVEATEDTVEDMAITAMAARAT